MTKNIGRKGCKSCGKKDCRGCGRKDCKKKGGALGINDGIYNFDDNFEINFFADLEGNMPDEIVKLTKLANNSNRAIVFTGDLLDRGAKSIRNLIYMLNLKETYEDRVVLTCGNRDLNKIRCYREFSVDYIERIIGRKDNREREAWEIFKIIIDEYDMKDRDSYIRREEGHFKFRFSAEQNEEYIALKGIWSNYGSEANFQGTYPDDLKERVNYIYKDTFGAPNQVDFFKEEFEELFKIYENYNICRQNEKRQTYTDTKEQFYNKYIHLFIITMNIIMGVHWIHGFGDPDINPDWYYNSVIANAFKDYNGLYIRYLQKCHIMSKITINDKLIIAAHSGIPYDDETKKFIIPSKIGREDDGDSSNESNINIENNIASLNEELTNFLKKVKPQYIKDDKYSTLFEFKEEFKKYIAMTAACLNECDKWKEDTTYTHSSKFSPIVAINSLNYKGPLKYKDSPILLDSNFNNYKKIYNIFGHQPAGLLPSLSKVTNNVSGQATYHIDLDISKAENTGGISNLESYAYLRITRDSHKFIGKTIAKQNISLLTNIEGESSLTGAIQSMDIMIPQYEISLDKYDMMFEKYKTKDRANNDIEYEIILHSLDKKKTYYGMCSQNFQLLKYLKNTDLEDYTDYQYKVIEQQQVGGISKKYKKSEKRFMNGKRKMVIYTGKRGAEYVKVKGVFISLAKYKKIISKDVKKIK
jgi:hypothetical protein